MSCGLPHEVPCSEILDRVYSYLDHELPEEGIAQVREHLDECAPCLREFGMEEAVKKLVHKSCGSEPTPADLRHKVLTRIEAVRVELEVTQFRAD
jgi:mycothiol system anti-sigma-R factor